MVKPDGFMCWFFVRIDDFLVFMKIVVACLTCHC